MQNEDTRNTIIFVVCAAILLVVYQVLVIGQYLDQLEAIAADLGAPLITGRMPNSERDVLYDKFRSGEVPLLVVSKVANFSMAGATTTGAVVAR